MSSISDEVAALRGTRSATLGDLIRSGPFARLLAAMTVSSLGDWVGFVAVTTLVARIGGVNAAIAISGVMLARTLPAFLFGPVAGVFVDRLDRRRLMMAADIGRGSLYLSMVLIQELWWIYLLSFLVECLGLVWGPARDATIPNLVPRRQLTNANSLTLVSTYGTLPLGGILFTITRGRLDVGGGTPAGPRIEPRDPAAARRRRHVRVLRVHAEPHHLPPLAGRHRDAARPVAGVARHHGRDPVPAAGLDRLGDVARDRDRLRRRGRRPRDRTRVRDAHPRRRFRRAGASS